MISDVQSMWVWLPENFYFVLDGSSWVAPAATGMWCASNDAIWATAPPTTGAPFAGCSSPPQQAEHFADRALQGQPHKQQGTEGARQTAQSEDSTAPLERGPISNKGGDRLEQGLLEDPNSNLSCEAGWRTPPKKRTVPRRQPRPAAKPFATSSGQFSELGGDRGGRAEAPRDHGGREDGRTATKTATSSEAGSTGATPPATSAVVHRHDQRGAREASQRHSTTPACCGARRGRSPQL